MKSRPNEAGVAGSKSPSRRTVLAVAGAVPVLTGAAAVATANAATPGTPSATQAAVVVDPSAERQTIQGFGGMNHTVWISDLTAAQRDTAFGTDEGQLGFSVLRIPVHEDQANWSGEVETAVRASELGAKVIASPWNPPPEMVETFSGGQRLRYDMYGAYAQHLNDFYTFMADNGVNLYAISVQNEPDYAEDWTAWTSDEIVRFLQENAAAIDTKVIAPESFQYRKNLSDPILNDSTALANMDILGAHLYGTQVADFPYPLFEEKGGDKELWMTEVYHPNSSDSADLWPQALDVGEHVHRALVDGQFQTYIWWYIRRSYGPMREDGQISKRGANMAHFSRFVRPGHVRVDATASPQSNVYTSAFKGEGSEVVIVAVNKGTSAVSQEFTVEGSAATGVASWLTDADRNLEAQAEIGMSDGSFTGELPTQSVTTFVTALGEAAAAYQAGTASARNKVAASGSQAGVSLRNRPGGVPKSRLNAAANANSEA
ncbi:glycoside hydrolase family 30 beta sandwich domain-containing protein [Glycomyces buryatensis]|uniref:Glucuronoxylanase n=1 Tax=Glycomyces buryatensis TaxID=2570927 RepID=A0A4S8PR54_9ACTN|nr:glucuronoxylanase [Glycomyces buryatensis]